MKIIASLAAAQRHVQERRCRSVLVPTMGALHRGHFELLRVARDDAGADGEVVVSIFVNPLQFEPGSDFEKYPRPAQQDEEACKAAGVDVLFRPLAADIYLADQSTYVIEDHLSLALEGKSRPGHFRGVCTIIAKLFNLLRPDAAVFGEKDYQQLTIVRRMVRDLNFSVTILGVSTVREPDGLAMSSRNRYLNASEREQAAVLYRAACKARALVKTGEAASKTIIAAAVKEITTAPTARVDYVEIVDGNTLEPMQTIAPHSRIMLAVFIGETRLIDNFALV